MLLSLIKQQQKRRMGNGGIAPLILDLGSGQYSPRGPSIQRTVDWVDPRVTLDEAAKEIFLVSVENLTIVVSPVA
jgi:hypothetical protein